MKLSDRWKYGAIPGLLIHGSIGTVYCWSLLTGAIKDCMGDSCDWAFSLAIFFLGISAAFLGPFVEKNVKLATLTSASCFGFGMILSGYACLISSPLLFHISFGLIMGIGLGIGYISPIKTMMMWFKDNKGLAAGLAIAGFGIAKVLGGPGFNYFIEHFGITEMFIFHGIFYFMIMFIAAMFIKKPGEKEKIKTTSDKLTLTNWINDLISIIKLKKVWFYWLAFYFNISAGLAIISNEVNFYNYSGITLISVGWATSMCAIFNSFGRLSVSWISDYLENRGILFGIIMLTSAICCIMGYSIYEFIIITVLLCNAGYGAMFAIMPSALHDRYGMKDVSKIHGFILSAWAFAGLTGNQLAKFVISLPNSYSPRIILLCSMILYLIGAYFCTTLWNNENSTTKEKTKSLQ